MKIKSIFYIFSIIILLFSCKKDDEPEINSAAIEQDVSFLFNQIVAYNTLKEIFTSTQQLIFNDSLFKLNNSSNSVNIIRDTLLSTDSIRITINYGNSIILCNDSKFRSGIFSITYDKNKNNTDTTTIVTINLRNLRVDSLTINGLIKIKNKGRINDTLRWETNSSFLLTNNYAKSATFSGMHIISLLNTNSSFFNYSSPINFNNSRIGIIGNANGYNIIGKNYEESNNKLEFNLNCNPLFGNKYISPFIKGQINYYMNGIIFQNLNTIDFGNNECDNSVTVKSKGYSVTKTFL